VFPMSYRTVCRCAAMATLASLVSLGAASEVIEQILVKVNGEIFTKSDLENRQVQELRQRGQQIDLKTEQGNAELRKALTEVTPMIMVNVIDEMLLVQRGKELGYRLNDEQFKSVVDSIKKENKLESEAQFQAALKQENMTMADLRRNVERSMIVNRVQQAEVFGRIAVSEDEAAKYYKEHSSEFTTPASIMLREILVAVPADAKGLNVALDDAAKEKADALRRRVTSGEAFDKVSAEVSDAASKANGGLIGPFKVDELSPDFRKIVDTMKAGDISQVVRTQRGYQILKLESSSPTQVIPFEQAREQISERVVTDKRRQEFIKYLAKLRTEAIIEFKNDDVKKAYEEGLAQQAKQMAASQGL
jgi:peptidyl-prolyl cis-trans isomerase SurA